MSDIPYTEYENMYPETVLIRKEGFFYMVRGESAAVIHAFFPYRGWKTSTDVVSIGFPVGALEMVCNKLADEKISYAVIVNGEIIKGNNFEAENRFNEFVSTDVSDIPYKAEKKKSEAKREHFYTMTDEEKKLCGISITYLERLLDGHHPVNNSVIRNDTVLTDVNVQRCFTFIVDILKKVSTDVVEDEEQSKNLGADIKNNKSLTFKGDAEAVIERMIQDKEVSISELEAIVKSYIKDLFEEEIDKITAVRISNWLVDGGYLVRLEEEDGSHHREATEEGKIIGMTNNLIQNGDMKPYVQYRFSPKAQRFIFENLPEIAVYKKLKNSNSGAK